MKEKFWEIVAKIVSQPAIRARIIRRAQKTPYLHLDGYMNRWWLFNPTPAQNDGKGRKFEWLPSIRIHHILREDRDRAPHNHPWNARTILLEGWYIETRDDGQHVRFAGDTALISADTFHNIDLVSNGGVWTMFISWKYQHSWGFRMPDGSTMPWRDYLKNIKGEF